MNDKIRNEATDKLVYLLLGIKHALKDLESMMYLDPIPKDEEFYEKYKDFMRASYDGPPPLVSSPDAQNDKGLESRLCALESKIRVLEAHISKEAVTPSHTSQSPD